MLNSRQIVAFADNFAKIFRFLFTFAPRTITNNSSLALVDFSDFSYKVC